MIRSRVLAAATLAAALGVSACDEGATAPTPLPVVGVTATAVSSSSIRLTFNSRASDDSYVIERAPTAGGTFASVGTADAPAVPGQVAFADQGLTITTQYHYRIITVIGSAQSAPSAEASATTLALGNATTDLEGDITTSRTLYADTVYTLKGFVHVLNGATLTIQAGTKIVGDFNTLGSSLFIMRGAQIQAVGTVALPIVFTSSQPVGSRKPGDWGGIVIVGNALLNRTGVTINVEGTDDPGGANNYPVVFSGGAAPADNSGTLSYVRAEFAGWDPSLGSARELNTFTFAAVGSGTRGSYLQAVSGLDDAFEWFGGGGDYDHLVAYETGDDAFDMSTGFQGRLQYLISYNSTQLAPVAGRGIPATDPQGLENDGCEGTGCAASHHSTPLNIPVVANFTLIGTGDVATSNSSGGFGMVLRRGTGGYYVNGVLARWPRAAIGVRDTATWKRGGEAVTPDLATSDIAVRNVVFSDNALTFQAGQAGAYDLAGNALTESGVAAATLFTALPAAGALPTLNSFDWTPAGGSAIATGGMNAFTGKLQTAAGAFVAPTAYMGAADPAGAKWWLGWTTYFRN